MKNLSLLLLVSVLALTPIRVSAMMEPKKSEGEETEKLDSYKGTTSYSKKIQDEAVIKESQEKGNSNFRPTGVIERTISSNSEEAGSSQKNALVNFPGESEQIEKEDLSDLKVLEQRLQEAQKVAANLTEKGPVIKETDLRNLVQMWSERSERYTQAQEDFSKQKNNNNNNGLIDEEQSIKIRLAELVQVSQTVAQALQQALENSSENSRIHTLKIPSKKILQVIKKEVPEFVEKYEKITTEANSLEKKLADPNFANDTQKFSTLQTLFNTYHKSLLIYYGIVDALEKRNLDSANLLYESLNKISEWYEECAKSDIAADEIFKEMELARLEQPRRILKSEEFINEFLENEKADQDAQSRLKNIKKLAAVEENHLYFENYSSLLRTCKEDAKNYKNALLIGNPLREGNSFFKSKGTYKKPNDAKTLDSLSRHLNTYQSSFEKVISRNGNEMHWNTANPQFIEDFKTHLTAGSLGHLFSPSNTNIDYSTYTPSIFSLDYYLSTPNEKIMQWVDENHFQQHFKDDLHVMQKGVEIARRAAELAQTIPSFAAIFRFYRTGACKSIEQYHAFKRDFYNLVLKKSNDSNYYLIKAQQAEQKADSLSNFMRDWKVNDNDLADNWLSLYKLTENTENVFSRINNPDLRRSNGGSDLIDSWINPTHHEEKLQIARTLQAWQSCQEAMRAQTEAANIIDDEQQKTLAMSQSLNRRLAVQEQLNDIQRQEQEIRRIKDQWRNQVEPIGNFGRVPLGNEMEYFERANDRYDR